MIQLYYHPGNASLAPHMLLEEIGDPFELVFVDRANAAHKSPEYLKLNPNGQIPVLVDGGSVVYEAAAICLHLADRYPDADADAAMQVRTRAEARAGTMLDRLDEQLAFHGGDWLLGSAFSAVDPYALMLCRWTRNFTRPARSLPRLAPYLQRMLARPAIQRAFATEKLSTPFI